MGPKPNHIEQQQDQQQQQEQQKKQKQNRKKTMEGGHGGHGGHAGQLDEEKKLMNRMKTEIKKILESKIYQHKDQMISDLFTHFLNKKNLLFERQFGLTKSSLKNSPLLRGGGG